MLPAPTPPTHRRRPATPATSSVGGLELDLLHPLLLTPPPEFVAARNALAKQLRAHGRRDDATAIGAIRRPPWTDWALNRAAAADTELARRFADAADRMRDAQRSAIAGGDADVAGALRSLRDAMAAMAKAAGAELRSTGRGADAAGLTERLTDVAGDQRLTAAVRAAVLTDDGDAVLPDLPAVEDVADVAEVAPTATRRARGASRDARSRSAEPLRESSGEADAAADRAEQRRRVQREASELRERRRTAERDIRRAERALGEAEHARELASAALERAQADLAAADERLAEVIGRRDALQRELADTTAALERIDDEISDIESSSESPVQATRRRSRHP